MSNLYKKYNPDILETIANLSNDEVFTPPKLANQILDLLPEEVWSNPNLTFLDPAVKTGIFLREITRRLIDGLADQIPDLQDRVNHILTKQVFGVGITELTTLMARRTVYCSMYANGPYSICTEFDDEKGNIIFPNTEHTWYKNGRCEYCGANKDNYGGGTNRENYAYPFIHDSFEKEFGNMKFDVIIGNPPYQLSDGEGTSSSPLYNIFVEKSIKLNPKYITMITPSRWMMGGSGLDKFRSKMMNDKRIKKIVDFENSMEIFPSVSINGGVSYFLWEKDYNGKVNYIYKNAKGEKIESNRYLQNNLLETVIRDVRQLSIIEKALNTQDKRFSELISPRMPFGFETDLFNNTNKYPLVNFKENEEDGYDLIYGIKDNKRFSTFINRDSITKGKSSIDKYKMFYPLAFGTETTLLPNIIKAGPGTLCTATFLKIGDFNSEKEMFNCYSYMKTKFFRALFQFNKYSFISSRRSFSLIPLQDFSKSWTDEELYKKYKLTQEEIDYIEETIEPMPSSDE